MKYEGSSVYELAEVARTADEPIDVMQAFLTIEDMELLHGWHLQSPHYDTRVVQWRPEAVSTETIKVQRIVPPEGWVPEVDEPESEPEEPATEPEPEEPPAEEAPSSEGEEGEATS